MSDILDTNYRSTDKNTDFQPETLPYATAVLVLGICSIVGCVFYGIIGLICGIICLVLHRKDKAIYSSNPQKYEMAFKNSRAGNICGIIGLSLSALYFVFFIIIISVGYSLLRFN